MNNCILRIKSSASMELMAKARELKSKGIDIIDLSGGEPDFDTPLDIKLTAISELIKGNTHYAVGNGLPDLRTRIAKKLKEDNKIDVTPNEIMVTPGSKMAIYLAVRSIINPGDEVLVFDPSWVSYKEIVVASGGCPISIDLEPTNNYKITEDKIKPYISQKTKMIIVNTPNNPTGRVLEQEEITVLRNIVLKYNLHLISDEIYEKITYNNKVISPASDHLLKDHTITINGFSKGYAMTGWRLGYLVANNNIINIISKLYSHSITGTSPFIQEAAIVALDCQKDVDKMVDEYLQRRNYFINALNNIPFVNAVFPEGAFYAWAEITFQDMDCNEFAEYLLKNARIVAVPGIAYGSNYTKYVRFSFAKDLRTLEKAIFRLREVLN